MAFPSVRSRRASDLATALFPKARPGDTAAAVWSAMTGSRFESADDVAVCEGERIVGVVRLEDLLAAPPQKRMDELMDPDPPLVAPGSDQERVAWQAVARGESSLPVVDEHGRLVGLIPPYRLMAVLLAEHDEDMARLSGFLHDTERARSTTEEPIGRRYRHRLPWLLVGLAGSLLAAFLVSGFEERLQAHLALAFFLPGIVYVADAVGTQTEAVIIRGLSVGASIRGALSRELLTGVLVGATLAAVFIPLGLIFWPRDVVVVVAISVLAACSVATLVAVSLPILLRRLGSDPAFGAGPLATVIEDLLSILIYLSLAVVLL